MAPNGDWLLPMYYTPNGFADMATHYSVMMRTSDQGASWQESRMSQAGQYLAQPSVVKLQNGDLLAFYRDRRAEWIYTSVSTDEGCASPACPPLPPSPVLRMRLGPWGREGCAKGFGLGSKQTKRLLIGGPTKSETTPEIVVCASLKSLSVD